MTRWTNAGLFLLNGGKWDLLLEACFGAVLAGLCVLALLSGIGRHFHGFHFAFFRGALIPALGLPISYENVLWGFQSQHFYFILFSVITIGCLPGAKPLSLLWWIGLLAGILACLSVGSGFYALLAAAVICGLMALRRGYRSRSSFVNGAVCLLLLAAYLPGLMGVHSEEQYKAHSASQFSHALVLSLAWPNANAYLAWSVLILQLPWVCLALAVLFRKQPLPPSSYSILGLARGLESPDRVDIVLSAGS